MEAVEGKDRTQERMTVKGKKLNHNKTLNPRERNNEGREEGSKNE